MKNKDKIKRAEIINFLKENGAKQSFLDIVDSLEKLSLIKRYINTNFIELNKKKREGLEEVKAVIIQVLKSRKCNFIILNEIRRCKTEYNLKRCLVFKLCDYHDVLEKNGIIYDYYKTMKLVDYKNEIINLLKEKGIENDKIEIIKSFSYLSSLKCHVFQNLEDFHEVLLENSIKFDDYSTEEISKEYFDRTEVSIKAILTRMGDKR